MAASPFVLRFSAADIWVKCPGSVRLSARYPEDEDSEEARDGTAGHWIATDPLLGRPAYLGNVAPNGVVVTQEMADGAALFQAAALQRLMPESMRIEETLPADLIHPQCGGTPDIWGWGFERWTMHVLEYKFGHGYVESFENWQMIAQAAAAYGEVIRQERELPLDFEERVTVEMTVVQPRSYHRDGPVRSWRAKLIDLRAQFNVLRNAAEEAMSDNPSLNTGVHCTYCPARHACPALQNAAYHVVDITAQAVPFDLNPLQVGTELRKLHHAQKLLESRIDGLEVQATTMLTSGQSVPNYLIDRPLGNLEWKSEMREHVIALGPLFKLDLAKKPEPITPTQAKSKGLPAAFLDEYAHRLPGKAKLVPLDLTITRKIFGGSTP